MALQHLRSSTANKRPTPAVMSDGQLAMNTNLASPGLFLKDSNGDLVKIGPVHVGTTAPNATPGAGGQAGNSKGEQWLDTTGGVYVFKIYDGTAWRSETGTFVDVNGDTMTGALGIIAGSAAAPGVFFSGDTNTGIYSPGADQVAVSTGGTGRLFIDASGRVGIGTSAPNEALHIASGGARISSSLIGGGASSLGLDYQSSNARFISYGPNVSTQTGLIFLTANSTASTSIERLRITSAGLVGIGASSPRVPLQVNTTTQFDSSLGRDTNALNLILESGGTPGDGEYSTGVTFSKINSDRPGAAISAVQTTSDNDTLGLAFLVHESSGTSDVLVEKVRINHAGFVGIGTSAPNYQLHVTTDFAVGASGFNQQLTFSNDTIQSLLLGTGYTALKLNPLGGNVGIGTASPGDKLDVLGIVRATNTTDSNFYSTFSNPDGLTRIRAYGGGSSICFDLGTSEKARIDSSGRLLVGTSSSRDNLFNTTYSALFQVESQATANAQASLTSTTAGVNGANLILCHQRSGSVGGNTVVQSDDQLGILSFQGADGTEMVPAASIEAYVDGTPGANDMPGRLVFSTTADGASSPTERMRITSTGQVRLAGAGITFNGDTATANELDDYEEGTWTPSVAGRTTTGTATYSVQSGTYRKIGSTVIIQCYIVYTGGTGTGGLKIDGLPFAAGSTSGQIFIGSVSLVDIAAPAGSQNFCSINPSASDIGIDYFSASGGSPTNNTYDANGGIYAQIQYFTN
jgi:hypothetical protein